MQLSKLPHITKSTHTRTHVLQNKIILFHHKTKNPPVLIPYSSLNTKYRDS